MQPPYHIQFLKRQQIDAIRWDNCISASANRLIYGYSYYLDYMTDGQWDALVLGDYLAVMPLPWRRKAGIRYVYQPAFTQQGGIFSPQVLTPAQVEEFLRQLGHQFRFAEIFLNYGNLSASPALRANFIIPLDPSYDQLAGRYKRTLLHDLQTAGQASLSFTGEVDPQMVLQGFRQEYSKRIKSLHPADFRRFEALCNFLMEKDRLIVRAVLGEKGQLLATALLPRDDRRLYLVQSTTPPAGRLVKANHFLLDQLIKEWAGSGMILDFEGSDLPGVSLFYRSFGAVDQPYFFYRYNRLPWPVRLLKRR